MKKKILAAFAVLLSSVAMVGFAFTTSSFATDEIKTIHEGPQICDEITIDDPNYDLYCKRRGETEGKHVVAEVLKVVFLWLGIIATIIVIVGGVLYMVALGNESGKIQHAKSTIIYALVGMVVSMLAFAIVSFVIEAYDSGNVKNSNSGNVSQPQQNEENTQESNGGADR